MAAGMGQLSGSAQGQDESGGGEQAGPSHGESAEPALLPANEEGAEH